MSQNESYPNSSDALYLTPDIPAGQLPPFLAQAISVAGTPVERDMLLLGALTAVSYALPQVRFLYGKPVRKYYPNLMVAVVAPAASGKGVLGYSAKLLQPIQDKLAESGRLAIIPPKTTSSSFIDLLEANGGTAFMLATEIDELTKAWKKGNGDYSTMFRQSFEHEAFRSARKLGPYESIVQVVKEPHLSVIISGTPKQLKPLLGSGENGLASRFLPYIVTESPEFNMDVYVSDEREAEELENPVYESLAKELYRRWEWLSYQQNTLFWKFTEAQWEELGSFFADHHALRELLSPGPDAYASMVKRLSVSAHRIGAVLSALRLEIGSVLPEKVYCSDEDFRTVMSLMDKLIYHGGAMVEMLSEDVPVASPMPSRTEEKMDELLEMLPERFTTADAKRCGEQLGMAERTVTMRLNELVNNKLVARLSLGRYKRR